MHQYEHLLRFYPSKELKTYRLRVGHFEVKQVGQNGVKFPMCHLFGQLRTVFGQLRTVFGQLRTVFGGASGL